MPIRHVDPVIVIFAFLAIVLAVPLAVAHLVERCNRFRIDIPD